MQTATLKTVLGYLLAQAGAETMKDLSDTDLLERFRSRREEAAFALLVQRHGPMVLGVCQRVLGDLHAAEDAFQATFLVLVRKADSICKQRSLASWLYGVAHRLAVRAQVQSASRRTRERLAVSSRPQPEPVDVVTRAELSAVVDEEIGRLADKYRWPLILCCLEGKTHEQAAQEMAWPKSSVTARLQRGRALLRQRLIRRGVALPGGVLLALLAEQTVAQAASARLVLATVRLAAAALAEQAAPATTAVALIGGMAKGLTTTKLTAVLTLLLTLGLAVAGVRVLASPKAEPKLPPSQPGARRTDEPKHEPMEAARTDRLGDPLPDGVLARMGSGRLRHPGLVRVLSFSPDGRVLVSADWGFSKGSQQYGGYLRLWDAATGKLQGRIDFKGGAVAFASDGLRVASVDPEKGTATIQFIDPTNGQVRRRVELHTKELGELTFSPGGAQLVLAVKDSVRFFDPATGQESHRIPCQTTRPVFSPDAKTMASCADSTDAIRLYSTADGKMVREFKPKGDHITDMVFSPEGRFLATYSADDGKKVYEVRIWDLTTGKERQRLKAPDRVYFAAFSPDGNYLATGGWQQREVILWDVATGKEVRRFPTDAGDHVHVAFSPDGKTLAAASTEGTIRLWDTATGRVLPGSADPLMDFFYRVRFSAHDKQVVGTAGTLIVWWDAATGRELRRWSQPPDCGVYWPPLLSPNESLIACQTKEETIQLWDAASRRQVRTLKPDKGVWRMLFSADGRQLIAGSSDGTIQLWDTASGRELHKWTGPRPAIFNWTIEPAISPDGRWLASAIKSESPPDGYAVILWDLATAREKTRFVLARHNFACQLAFSPDSRLLAAACGSGSVDEPVEIKVWDVANGKEWCHLDGNKQRASSVTFSPDGRTLATGGEDGTLVLWELASGKRRHQFTGHKQEVRSLAFSSDGRRLAATSYEAPVYVWDIAGTLQPQRLKLSAAELERCWADLGSEDAEAAFRAVRLLGAAPDSALPFLRDRLKPVLSADPKRLAQLLKSLDSPEFAERQQAATELEKLADADASTLRRTVRDTSSAEVRRALQDILDRLDAGTPEQLRNVRVVEALEWMAAPDTAKLLGTLATGAAEARLTREAKAAVQRIKAKQE